MNESGNKIYPERITGMLILMLSLITSFYLYREVLAPFIMERMCYEQEVLAGETVAPYLYRPLWPWLSQLGMNLFEFTGLNTELIYKLHHGTLNTLLLGWMYWQIFIFFKLYINEMQARMGLILFALFLLAGVNGYYMEENLLLVGGNAWMLRQYLSGKNKWLIPGMLLLALNREQVIMIPVWLGLTLLAENQKPEKKNLLMLGGLCLSWMLVFVGLRISRGMGFTPYTPAFHWQYNFDQYHLTHFILPLWAGLWILPGILAWKGRKQLPRVFHFWLLSLPIYFALFSAFGKWTEPDKAMSAYLFLIPCIIRVMEHKKT